MDFVEGERLGEPVGLLAAVEPLLVVPVVASEIDHLGGGTRGHLGREPVGVRLLEDMAVMADLELVDRPLAGPGDKQLPEPAGNVFAHRVASRIPGVEVADYAHPGGVGRPDGEVDPLDAIDYADLCTELLVGAIVPALVEQVQVVVGQEVREGIGIMHRGLLSALFGDAYLVALVAVLLVQRANGLEQARRMDSPHGASGGVVGGVNHPGLLGIRQKRPHGHHAAACVGYLVGAQRFKRILIGAVQQPGYLVQRDHRTHACLLAPPGCSGRMGAAIKLQVDCV